jgi:hypothetical protein
MIENYEDFYMQSRGRQIGEPGFIPNSPIPKLKFDPVTKKFADILRESAERPEDDYDSVPKSITVAVVANFPGKDGPIVKLFTPDYESIVLVLKLLGKLSKLSIQLSAPYGGI